MHDEVNELTALRPTADLDVTLCSEDAQLFEARWFVSIERIATDEELLWLRRVYDCIFSGRAAAFRGVSWDLVRPVQSTGKDQLMRLDEGALEGWGHMVYKPARIGAPLAWHLDEAYWEPALIYRALGRWMPLDDATPANGAMKFVPGSHTSDVCRHHHLNSDPATPALYADVTPAEEASAVVAPLRTGGATLHHSRTLHVSGPNRSECERRAYANEWQYSPQEATNPFDRACVEEPRKAMAALRARRST